MKKLLSVVAALSFAAAAPAFSAKYDMRPPRDADTSKAAGYKLRQIGATCKIELDKQLQLGTFSHAMEMDSAFLLCMESLGAFSARRDWCKGINLHVFYDKCFYLPKN